MTLAFALLTLAALTGAATLIGALLLRRWQARAVLRDGTELVLIEFRTRRRAVAAVAVLEARRRPDALARPAYAVRRAVGPRRARYASNLTGCPQ